MRIKRSLAAIALPLALVAAGCADDTETADTTTTEATAEETTTTAAEEAATTDQTLVEIAAGNPDFSTLVELVTAAGLAEALSAEGPFTIFAPTNEAFAKLPAETVASLTADPTGALADILKLHVVSGKILAADAVAAAGTSIETLNGGKLLVELQGEDVVVGGSKVVSTDIEGSNGVIHVIDTVITEPNG